MWVEGALIGFALAGQEEIVGLLEVVCHICHVTAAAKEYLVPEEPAFSIGNRNDSTSWGQAVNLGNVPTDDADPNGWQDCYLSLCRVAHWTDQHYNCDKFDQHGWVAGGPFDQHAKEVINVVDEPYFSLIPGHVIYTGPTGGMGPSGGPGGGSGPSGGSGDD